MELDHLRLKATADRLEGIAFGPVPEHQVRQLSGRPPARPIRLEAILETLESEQRFLQWLSWDATFEDARRALVAFHAAVAWATSGSEGPTAVEALRILRDEPDARALIKLALPKFPPPA